MAKQRVNDLSDGQKKAVAELLGVEGPVTLVLIKALHLPDPVTGHLGQQIRLELKEFTRTVAGVKFTHAGATREVPYANIAEIVYG